MNYEEITREQAIKGSLLNYFGMLLLPLAVYLIPYIIIPSGSRGQGAGLAISIIMGPFIPYLYVTCGFFLARQWSLDYKVAQENLNRVIAGVLISGLLTSLITVSVFFHLEFGRKAYPIIFLVVMFVFMPLKSLIVFRSRFKDDKKARFSKHLVWIIAACVSVATLFQASTIMAHNHLSKNEYYYQNEEIVKKAISDLEEGNFEDQTSYVATNSLLGIWKYHVVVQKTRKYSRQANKKRKRESTEALKISATYPRLSFQVEDFDGTFSYRRFYLKRKNNVEIGKFLVANGNLTRY